MNEFNNMRHYLEMDSEINKSRVLLNFQDSVIKNFDYLIDQFDFILIEANILLVQYESSIVFVKIYHDRLSYELEIYIGIKAPDSKDTISYSLLTILGIAGFDNYQNFKAITKKDMDKYIPMLSNTLKIYGIRALQGDIEYFKQLEEYSKNKSFQLNVEYKERQIGKEAQDAWNNHDYEQVVNLFSNWERYLSEDEKNRFEYAKKQMIRRE